MRGVKCSWKEMQRLHREVLPAIENGQGEKYAELRCLKPAAISNWRASSAVMDVLDRDGIQISEFENFQPSHAELIARHFRKREKDWSDETKAEIIETVDRCEAEGWTVEQLRSQLKAATGEQPSVCPESPELSLADALDRINKAVRSVLERWPKDCLETLGRKLVQMGNEILETGGLRE